MVVFVRSSTAATTWDIAINLGVAATELEPMCDCKRKKAMKGAKSNPKPAPKAPKRVNDDGKALARRKKHQADRTEKPTSRSKTGNCGRYQCRVKLATCAAGQTTLDPETYRTLAKCGR